MRVLVINMEKSKDRWNRISRELEDLNVEFERFPAVVGKQLSEDEINQCTTLMARTIFCTHASVGCALSHINIWKKFINSGEDFICVAEDDATFSEEFPKVLKDIPSIFKQTDFDIFELYNDVITDGEPMYINNYYKIVSPNFGLATCCYILSKKGAIKLHELFGGKVSFTIDFHIALLNSRGKIKQLLLVDPEVVKPSSEASTINNLNSGGIMNRILEGFENAKEIKKYTNANTLNICMKYSISPYLVFLISLFIISLLKKWYILAVIIGVEFVMLVNDV